MVVSVYFETHSSTTSVALTLTIVLQNLTSSHIEKSGESKYDRKLTALDVVALSWPRIRCRVDRPL